jgi:sigma-E factor negative regulatory protein RseC
MEQVVRVSRLLPGDMAEVIRVRESACSGDCHKCSGCGAAKQTVILTARNAIGARVGDMVVVSSDSSRVLKAAAVLYMLPLVLFLAGYLVGENLWGRGVLLGLVGIVLGIALVKLYDRFLAKTGIEYTITSYAGENASA